MITTRDNKVLEFIDEYKVACTSTIAELFYPSRRMAQNRLRKLVDVGEIKRTRYYYMEEYIYYQKKNNQFKHNLVLTNFYRELHKRSKIIRFNKEFTYFDGLRPDAFIVFSIGNSKYIAFVEVELSKKGFDLGKYKKLYMSEKYKECLPVFPLIMVISDHKIKESDEFNIIKIDTELERMEKLYEIIN
ncbi:MAG: hypothetical protein GY714_23580 [Desulfobacterales bacterium]|nr:hypothetical protein [Desulfobacterales bacterium]